ncbi:MAG: stage II sporulation protein P [Bacillota bacterium]
MRRSWTSRLRERLPRGLDVRILAAYGLVIGAIVAVLAMPAPGPDGGAAVPALAGAGGGGAGVGTGVPPAAVSWFWSPDGGMKVLRASLQAGMPVLAWPDEAAGRRPRAPYGAGGPSLQSVGGWLRRLLGINPLDPRSLLAAEVPGMKDPGPADHGEDGQEGGESPLDRTPAADVTNPPPVASNRDPLVAIYQTHAYESYLKALDLPAGAPLTYAVSNDDSKNIVSVGARLARSLADLGIPVVHSQAHHGPQVGAYVRSRQTAEAMLRDYPSVQVLVDVHRDSQPRSITTATVAGQPVARVMMVVARGSSSLKQPNYPKNLEFARTIFAEANRRYPGLMRPVYEEPARYNQDLLPGAVLFEIGGPENSLDETYRSIDMLSRVLADLLLHGKYPRPPKAATP